MDYQNLQRNLFFWLDNIFIYIDYLIGQIGIIEISTYFVIPIFSAAAGAYFGGLGAQNYARKLERKERISNQVASINYAIGAYAALLDVLVDYKKQLVRSMCDAYFDDIERLKSHDFSKGPFEHVADLKSLPEVWVPLNDLNSVLSHETNIHMKGMQASFRLNRMIDGLNQIILERNNFIVEFRSTHDNVKQLIYFARPLPNGSVDTRYLSYMTGLKDYMDDSLFYCSVVLCELEKAGIEVKEEYPSSRGDRGPKVISIDYSAAARDGVIPDSTNYTGWLDAFKD